jgi:hypothetical protein
VESVTVEEIQRVANTYLLQSSRTVGHYLAEGRDVGVGDGDQEESA